MPLSMQEETGYVQDAARPERTYGRHLEASLKSPVWTDDTETRCSLHLIIWTVHKQYQLYNSTCSFNSSYKQFQFFQIVKMQPYTNPPFESTLSCKSKRHLPSHHSVNLLVFYRCYLILETIIKSLIKKELFQHSSIE